MKSQIKQMDRELEQYHKSNAQLDLMIGELRARLDAMQREILEQRKKICDSAAVIRRFKSELHECVQYIQSPEKLRDALAALHRQHVQRELPKHELDVNVQHEYHRHREYLERSLLALKDQFSGDVAVHRAENMRVMQDNMALIREINKQREDNKAPSRRCRRSSRAAAAHDEGGRAGAQGRARGRARLAVRGRRGRRRAGADRPNREQIPQPRAHIREARAPAPTNRSDVLPPMNADA